MAIIHNISIIFISIFLESLPFLLLGSFISSLVEIYISQDTIAKMIPKNKVLASFVGVFLGFFIPACDCAVIPVTKRLLKKKVPIHVAIAFMLSSPIINPVVLLSTHQAFYKTNPEIFYLRLILGIIISFLTGLIMTIFFHDKEVIRNSLLEEEECSTCHTHHNHNHSIKNDFLEIMRHTTLDTFDVIKYLMFGALLASLMQVLVPRNILSIFQKNLILSTIVLMIFAYLISLCSTSDSFVGKSLLSSFSNNAIVAYLLLGPMIDIKNTIVLLGNYKKNFVWTLMISIFILVFLASVLVVSII